ncbi:hypothetical protein [Flavobacterium algicola]|uniref:hypothetical protein n=1 Tax=Flavobacterium algicola TaxID=556529 RepID=UPI001EFDD150|nr:hypothetical protein [Flavobacterium algicola]MCG9791899.1 hypothetical protein [Flavobacterium algicola]
MIISTIIHKVCHSEGISDEAITLRGTHNPNTHKSWGGNPCGGSNYPAIGL